MEEAHERKKPKYQPLMSAVKDGRHRTSLTRLAVWDLLGSGSLSKAHGVLGITAMTWRRAIADICRQPESASKWLLQMGEQQWTAYN
ncbi:hypothetical protein DPMN_176316 [Dreissena polymorpha]|uniref:Uncharacterized protein n=1 Tax=Dreissena polymorpha TaxID=45954 RepID=A0A9D4IJI6_DREPO|nr:hypothetical protein DPMN_176316 [Dreissena polymorpha]